MVLASMLVFRAYMRDLGKRCGYGRTTAPGARKHCCTRLPPRAYVFYRCHIVVRLPTDEKSARLEVANPVCENTCCGCEGMPRPTCYDVAPQELLDLWEPMLNLKNPGFDWGAKDYLKPKRSQSVDKPGLVKYKPALSMLLTLAPSGYVTQSSLRNVLMQADKTYNILSETIEVGRWKAADNAADIWRKMSGDIYQLRKGGLWPEDLHELCTSIVLESAASDVSALNMKRPANDLVDPVAPKDVGKQEGVT